MIAKTVEVVRLRWQPHKVWTEVEIEGVKVVGRKEGLFSFLRIYSIIPNEPRRCGAVQVSIFQLMQRIRTR